jgi:hypothetical protein
MSSVQTANRAGQKFYNIACSDVGWVKDAVYDQVKAFYQRTFS